MSLLNYIFSIKIAKMTLFFNIILVGSVQSLTTTTSPKKYEYIRVTYKAVSFTARALFSLAKVFQSDANQIS